MSVLARWAWQALARQRLWWGNASLLAVYFLAVRFALDTDIPQARLSALGLTASIALLAWVGNTRRQRTIEDIPTSRIASAAQGYTELKGVAAQFPDSVLPAPLSQTPCVWYRYQIESRDVHGQWRVADHGTSDDSFLLRDDSGSCVIDPDGAEVTTSRKRVWTEGDGRYTEYLLLPGDSLYAIGEFRTLSEPAAAATLSQEVGELLAEWKRDPARLRQRFDADGDGEISLDEWEVARRAARQEVEARARERAASAPLNVLARPRDGRPFLISNLDPARLVWRYRLWALTHLAMFLAACAGFAATL
jgi:hypothetical protein